MGVEKSTLSRSTPLLVATDGNAIEFVSGSQYRGLGSEFIHLLMAC